MIRLVADDRTGALDAAAAFASPGAPLPVLWRPPPAEGGWALDTETRRMAPGRTERRLFRVLPRLRRADIAFKKIDSLLRGNTLREIVACAAAGAFRNLVIAPSFPAQGRATRGGRQWARDVDGAWRPIGADIARALADAGYEARLRPAAGPLDGSGIFLCDAESDDDLARVAAHGRRLTGPVLWCGTGGLAKALSGNAGLVDIRPAAPLLVVVGTNHPVTVRQVQLLAEREPDLVGIEPEAAAERIGRGDAALWRVRPPSSGDRLTSGERPTAGATLARRVADLAAAVPRPGSLVVTGGATLARLCARLEMRSLQTVGAWREGIPVSIVDGGPWDGLRVFSKSGAFGDADTLVDLVRLAREEAGGAGARPRIAPRGEYST